MAVMSDPARSAQSGSAPVRQTKPTLKPGDFYTDGKVLYEILLVDGDDVILENSRTEWTHETNRARVYGMRRVEFDRKG